MRIITRRSTTKNIAMWEAWLEWDLGLGKMQQRGETTILLFNLLFLLFNLLSPWTCHDLLKSKIINPKYQGKFCGKAEHALAKIIEGKEIFI